jgi:hypothetical protein
MFAALKKNVHRMKHIALFLFLLILSIPVSAQDSEPRKWGIETDILWPIFPGATRTHLTYTLWNKGGLQGDVYVGISADFPQDRETEGRFADYSIASGYRQYLWKGLHVEFSQTTGLGVLENHVSTGKDYRSFDWLMTGYAGYRFDLPGKRFYVIPQFGVARVVYKSNPWPIFEDETLTKEVGESAFMLGSLRFGLSF